MPDFAKGIDVSHWKVIKSWADLERSGVRFVGMKATEGNSVTDKTLASHRDGFRQHGFHLGIYYHFGRSGNAVRQAERFIETVGPLEKHERLALDFEVMTTLEPEDGLEWISDFVGILKRTYPDRRPLIYTSKRIWRMIGNPAWTDAASVDLWVPRYNTQGIPPALPKPWENVGWTFWQWTDGEFPDHVTPGVGRCDANHFRGNDAALSDYASLSGGASLVG